MQPFLHSGHSAILGAETRRIDRTGKFDGQLPVETHQACSLKRTHQKKICNFYYCIDYDSGTLFDNRREWVVFYRSC